MKSAIATTLAAALLAASSLAYAADNNANNNGGKNNNQDQTTTGSIHNRALDDPESRQDCRDGAAGGAPCQEPGTVMPQN